MRRETKVTIVASCRLTWDVVGTAAPKGALLHKATADAISPLTFAAEAPPVPRATLLGGAGPIAA
jgi:hypothetical protein